MIYNILNVETILTLSLSLHVVLITPTSQAPDRLFYRPMFNLYPRLILQPWRKPSLLPS